MKCYNLFEAGKYRVAYLEFIQLYENTGEYEYLEMASKSASRGDITDEQVVEFFANKLCTIEDKDTLSALSGFFADRELYEELRSIVGHELYDIIEKIEEQDNYGIDALSFLETHYKFKIINTINSEKVEEYVSRLLDSFSKTNNGATGKYIRIREYLWQHFYLEEDSQELLSLAKSEASNFDGSLTERIKLLKACEDIESENGDNLDLIRASNVLDQKTIELINALKEGKNYSGDFSEVIKHLENESSKLHFIKTYLAQSLGVILAPKLIWQGNNIANEGVGLALLETSKSGVKPVLPRDVYVPPNSEDIDVRFISTEGLENFVLSSPIERDSPKQIYIDDIDSFSKVKEVERSDIEGDRMEIYEDKVKDVIREIIDEPFDQNDWGGEINDLYTSAVEVAGERVDTAFMLKGVSVDGEMYIGDAGSRGDQIQRLFEADADLYVFQYVGKINDRTVKEVKEKAEFNEAKYVCLIDGTDTARLVEAYRGKS